MTLGNDKGIQDALLFNYMPLDGVMGHCSALPLLVQLKQDVSYPQGLFV